MPYLFLSFLYDELVTFRNKGIIKVKDPLKAADFIVTLMEGMEFHAQFLGQDAPFERFAETAKLSVYKLLEHEVL